MKKNLLILLCMLLIFSCKKDDKLSLSNTSLENKDIKDLSIENLTELLSKELNVKQLDIVYNGSDSTFIIENDILISRKDLVYRLENKKKSKTPTSQQYRNPYLVSDQYISNIKVYIHAGVPTVWRSAIAEAILNWNSTLTRVRFSMSSYAAADIRIDGSNYSTGPEAAKAYYPIPDLSGNVRPGDEITINYYFNEIASSEQKVSVIAHELGHTIGLMHTNETDGAFIPGTPTVDYYSVMNSSALLWSGFTNGDITAVNIMYPFSTIYNNAAYTTSNAFPKTDCGPGYIGTAHTNTISANTIQSVISQYEADSRAQILANQNGFTNANLVGSCVIQMIGGINRMWWQGQEIYTFYHKPIGSTVTWTVTAPLRIVGSNTGDTITVELDPAYPVPEDITYGQATITGTVGTVEYHRDIEIKYQ